MNERFYVTKPSEIPKQYTYAVLVFDSVWIEGDERSRTNPGHGYPGHSEQKLSYILFKNEEALTEWIRENETRTLYAVLEARQLTVEKTISLKVS